MIDRRQLILAGMYGLGALSVPGVASILHARGFTHGVASGEPSIDSILLWTRFVAEQDTRLRVELKIGVGSPVGDREETNTRMEMNGAFC